MARQRAPRWEFNYVHYGCIFPVVLSRVQMISCGGDNAIVMLDHRRFTHTALEALLTKPTRLTGNEVRFIRHHHEMTLADFGKRFDVSHAAVKKWESKNDAATGMGWTTELAIRLFILEKLGTKPREFRRIYGELVEPRPAGPCTIRLDLEKSPPEIRYQCEAMAAAS